MDAEALLSKLENLYFKTRISSTRKAFFLSIVNYIDFVYKKKELNFIFNLLEKQKQEDLKEIDEARKNAFVELRKAFNKIKSFVEKKKIKNEGVLYELKEFNAFEKGTAQTTGDEIEVRYSILTRSLYYLMRSEGLKYKNFYQKFAKFTDDFKNIEWSFSPNVYKYLDLLPKIGRIKESRPWFSFDKLNNFYIYFMKIEDLQKEAREKLDYFETIGLALLKEDINTIINKEEEPTKFVKINDYKYYLDLLHFFIKEAVFELKKQKEVKKYKWEYDPNNAVFTVNSKKVNLRKESFRAKMLELITKNQKNIKKIWYWDEIAEKIEKLKDEEKLKNKIYETGRDINEIIASKTGITNFLIVKTQTIQINPVYLE